MEIFYLSQGHLTNDPPLVKANSTAFLHGESIFTSFLAVDGKVKGLEAHKKRIRRAANLFGDIDEKTLTQQSFSDLKANSKELQLLLKGAFRVRLTYYRENEIKYFWSFQRIHQSFETKTVKTVIWERNGEIFNFKSADYAKVFSMLRKNQSDDILKVGIKGELFDLSTSSLLVKINGEFVTPAVSSNVIQSCQLSLLNQLPSFSIGERKLHLGDLFKADFVLGSNAVKEFFLISHVDEKPLPYPKKEIDEFLSLYFEESSKLAVDLC